MAVLVAVNAARSLPGLASVVGNDHFSGGPWPPWLTVATAVAALAVLAGAAALLWFRPDHVARRLLGAVDTISPDLDTADLLTTALAATGLYLLVMAVAVALESLAFAESVPRLTGFPPQGPGGATQLALPAAELALGLVLLFESRRIVQRVWLVRRGTAGRTAEDE